MSRHAKTEALIAAAAAILAEQHPMTLRQLHYQLVSRQATKNTAGAYNSLSKAMIAARKEGIVPWDWMEDRLRKPRHVAMWNGVGDFIDTVISSYRRDVWAGQSGRVECWLEKDALSGIFEELLDPYGVTLNVGRGFDGWDSIHNAALRYGNGENVAVIYFGDFDPSGEDMVRSLRDRLAECSSRPEIIKAALTREDIDRYGLPPDFTKSTDTRSAAFVAKHGDISVELDALPLDVLKARIIDEITTRMDVSALEANRAAEDGDRGAIQFALAGLLL